MDEKKTEDLSSEELGLLKDDIYQQIMVCQQSLRNINAELIKRQGTIDDATDD
jgi:hypothetical protein